jgi:hypothetical protein
VVGFLEALESDIGCRKWGVGGLRVGFLVMGIMLATDSAKGVVFQVFRMNNQAHRNEQLYWDYVVL